jgi:pimeloyl-ACP methyl ester carboxylesterase
MEAVTEGELSTGVPYLKLGQGPPLVMASGMTSEHTNPQGMWRKLSLSWAAPFAEHFTVYLVNRRAGLTPGTTMADVAADYAGAIEQDIGGPVMLHGTSLGGALALQLAIDRPDLVQRMVVSASACRLSPYGLRVEAEVLRLIREGHGRRASAMLMAPGVPRSLGPAARAMGWLTGGGIGAHSDMVIMIAAEHAFDVESELSRIQAPTLVLGGSADRFYSEDLFRRTASGISQGDVVILSGKSHVNVAGSKAAAALALEFLVG